MLHNQRKVILFTVPVLKSNINYSPTCWTHGVIRVLCDNNSLRYRNFKQTHSCYSTGSEELESIRPQTEPTGTKICKIDQVLYNKPAFLDQ